MLGHLYGPGSTAWRMQLRQVDRLVESIIEGLPPGGLLAVVADHGMVSVDTADVVDIDSQTALADGVTDIGGEARARHIYVAPGATDDVLATWRATSADRAWVVSARRGDRARGGSASGSPTRPRPASATSSRPPAARQVC